MIRIKEIKEIEIPTPKWWKVGLIIIAIIVVISVMKEDPERALKVMENMVEKLP